MIIFPEEIKKNLEYHSKFETDPEFDIMPDRYKGIFSNVHTKDERKVTAVYVVPQAEGGFVIELDGEDRWSMKLFCEHWSGEWKSKN